jgi:NADPH-dependent curcumin reductase CurA
MHREFEPGFRSEVSELVRSGKISLPEAISKGFEAIPRAFEEVFTSSHLGKALVKVRD